MTRPPTTAFTFLFTDIEGSTRLWENHPEAMRLALANHDDLLRACIESHGGRVFKTIGDAYMAAAGLDAGAQIHYADAIARMALEMQQKVTEYREKTGERIELRVGIGTGPVVAGVIGKKKFIYDMWGDTVNVAFRMAAEAGPGTVQVDAMTHRRLQTRFRFDSPHEVDIKGKGRMQVYHLIAPATPERASA